MLDSDATVVRILGGKEEVFRGEYGVLKWWKGKKEKGEMMWKGWEGICE